MNLRVWECGCGKMEKEQLTIAVCSEDCFFVCSLLLFLCLPWLLYEARFYIKWRIRSIHILFLFVCLLFLLSMTLPFSMFSLSLYVYKLRAWLLQKLIIYIDYIRMNQRIHSLDIVKYFHTSNVTSIAITCGALSCERIHTPLSWIRLDFLQHSTRLNWIGLDILYMLCWIKRHTCTVHWLRNTHWLK